MAWLTDEPGADDVEAMLLSDAEVAIPWPALMEIYYLVARRLGEDAARVEYAGLKKAFRFVVDSWDESTWLQAAKFKRLYAISIADSMIAALAFVSGATLVHKDPEFAPLGASVRLLALPFEPRLK